MNSTNSTAHLFSYLVSNATHQRVSLALKGMNFSMQANLVGLLDLEVRELQHAGRLGVVLAQV